MKNGKHVPVSPEEFVKLYQTAKTVTELAKRLGVGHPAVVMRAAMYRKKGVPLRKFPRNTKGRNQSIDYKALAAVARKYAPKP